MSAVAMSAEQLEEAYAQLSERKWQALCAADAERDLAKVTSKAFAFLMHTLDANRSMSTGAAIVGLEQRLRAENRNTYCIARRTEAPLRSRTYAGEATFYHLYFTCKRKAEAKRERDEIGGGRAENLRRLAQCGFLERYTADEEAEQRRRAVALPDDLVECTEATFDETSVAQYCNLLLGAIDATTLMRQLRQHAEAVRRGQPSSVLKGSGVQVLRTSVPLEQWTKTRAALCTSIAQQVPMAEATAGAVRNRLVPIGFQTIGQSHATDDTCMLFDLYLVQMSKFIVPLSDEQRRWLLDGDSADDAAVRSLVSSLTGTRVVDLQHVTAANVWNYIEQATPAAAAAAEEADDEAASTPV